LAQPFFSVFCIILPLSLLAVALAKVAVIRKPQILGRYSSPAYALSKAERSISSSIFIEKENNPRSGGSRTNPLLTSDF